MRIELPTDRKSGGKYEKKGPSRKQARKKENHQRLDRKHAEVCDHYAHHTQDLHLILVQVFLSKEDYGSG